MKYLLDTDIIIDHLRRKNFIQEEILGSGAISIITLGELIYGAYKSINPQKFLVVLNKDLYILDFEIVNISETIVAEFGRMKAALEIKGEKLDDFDLLIAASAKVMNLTLVTRNVKHFKRIKGLKLL